MRIIIEEYKYAAADVKDILKGIDALENVEGYVSVNYVGYFYNTDASVRDCVFVLPKVLLEDKEGKDLVFGKYRPEDMFRTEIQKMLTEQYSFYAMQAHPGVDAKQYLKEHFQQTLGKIFTPFEDDKTFSLALDKQDPEGNNEELLTELRKHFYVVDNAIGKNPEPAIATAIGNTKVFPTPSGKQGVLMVMMEHFAEKLSKFLPNGKIAIGIKYTKDSMEIVEHLSEIGFLLFHTRKDIDQHLYKVNKVEILPEEELPANIYKNINTAKMYAKVEFEKIELDASSLHSSRKAYTPETRYDAQYITLKELHYEFELQRFKAQFEPIIEAIKSINAKSTAKKREALSNIIININNNEYTKLSSLIHSVCNDYDQHLLLLLSIWQILETKKIMGADYRRAIAFSNYQLKKQTIDSTLSELNPFSDRFRLVSQEKERSLIINWPEANAISNVLL